MTVHSPGKRLPALALHICLGMLALVPIAHAQQPTQASSPMQLPRYPPEMARIGAQGTTILLLSQTPNGKIVDAQVERSSGHAELDQAAIDAALTWSLPPVSPDQPVARLRVPVDFKVPSPDEASAPTDPQTLEEQRRFRERWEQMQVAPVTPARDGTLPGYLPDPQPLPAATAAEVLALLQANAELEPDLDDGVVRYKWVDVPLITYYEVFDEGWSNNLTVLRSRLVTDGEHAFWMQRYQCDAPDPQECAVFEKRLRKTPRQPGLTPPPPPPPAPPPTAGPGLH